MTAREYWERHRTFIVYNIFGFSATLLETFLYWLFFQKVGWNNIASTLASWIITITYAFFTNKLLVYKSKTWRLGTLIKEMAYFYAFRAITGLFNVAYMYITVDLLAWWPVAMKAIAALIVGLMNYILGKRIVFKDGMKAAQKFYGAKMDRWDAVSGPGR